MAGRLEGARLVALYAVSALATLGLAEIVATRNVAAPWLLAQSSPGSVGLATLFILSLTATMDAALGRRFLTVAPIAALCLAFAFVSSEKFKYLSEPLYPWDFLFIRQVRDLLPILFKGGSSADYLSIFAVFVVAALLGWLMYVSIRRTRQFGAMHRLALGLPALLGLTWSAWVLSPDERASLRGRTGILSITWDQPMNYNTNGHLLAFALNLNSILVAAPEGYDQANADNWTSKDATAARAAPSVRPNVIVVMSEAFWDPTRLSKVQFSQDPMPFVRNPGAGAQTGWLFSPQLAGGTCNVEFEALTGFSNAFLPIGSIPYQQYIRATLPSLPRLLKHYGYKTMAVHPYHKWFWNRTAVYQHLGFDAFLGLEDMGDMPKQGYYAGDKALMEKLHRLTAETADPLFLFAITMQNHAPYEPNRFGPNQIEVEGPLTQSERAALQSFSQGIKISDAALQDLAARLTALNEPTLLVFFGDHLPYLAPQLSTFRASGFIGPETSLTSLDYENMHKTPFLIWSNFQAEIPAIDSISPSLVPYVIARTLGIEHPYFSKHLGHRYASTPVIDRRLVIDTQGTVYDRTTQQLPQPLESDLNAQWMLEYDILFGERLALPALFCELNSSCAGAR